MPKLFSFSCVALGRLAPALILVFSLVWVSPALAEEPLGEQLRALAHAAEEGQEAAEHNNVALMQAEYEEIHTAWESFENDVRAQNPTAYVELEGALHVVKAALQTQPLDPAAVEQAYAHLKDEAEEIAARFGGDQAEPVAAVEASPAELMRQLDAAYQATEAGETHEAAEQLTGVIRAWPSVEGAIAAKSQDAYTAIEVDLSRAKAALAAEPADLSSAEAALERLRETLAPFVAGQTYTMFDAATIILREGLEALLVIVALLAFLQRSGNNDKRIWIWAGGLLGILASVVAAFALQAVFSYASSGQNREIVEGVTGLLAAGLLFYVSYWLHSKASLHAWQSYIKTNTTRALAQGSVAGLAVLSFLAVFREGAETAVFYLGMASAIRFEDLWLGLGLGVAVLVVSAFLMLKVGLKLPLRPFFRIAGLLVYYLGFKFVGAGIHALQVSGALPATPIGSLPAIPFIGFYPTWETAGPQILLLVGALVVGWYLRAQDRQARRESTAAVTA